MFHYFKNRKEHVESTFIGSREAMEIINVNMHAGALHYVPDRAPAAAAAQHGLFLITCIVVVIIFIIINMTTAIYDRPSHN